MKAVWNGTTIAESDHTIVIEGNHYFPPDSVHREFLTDSQIHTVCPWKGEASYYNVRVNGEINQDAAWYYPSPKAGSIERVGDDYRNFVAFWHDVKVQ
jgi:uncharacterized protein (DUF427 family)